MFQQQPTRLTQDAVQQIVNKTAFPSQSFIMQVLSITNNYLGHYYSQLSDGFCNIRCQLVNDVKILAQNQKLVPNSIIRFNYDHIELMEDNQHPSIVLKQCQVLKTDINKTIGSPMPYKLFKEKGFSNEMGSNIIQSGARICTIRQILTNQRMKNSTLRGRATNLPKNTKMCMFIFKIIDSNNEQISAVAFEQIADKLLRELQQGQQYIFSNFVLQKNRRTNADEIKFKSMECAVPVIPKKLSHHNNQYQQKPPKNNPIFNDSQSQPQIFPNKMNQNSRSQDQNQQNKSNIFVQKQKQRPKQQPLSQQQKTYTKRQIYDLIKSNQTKDKFFDVVGKVTYLNAKAKFRKINIKDINNDQIDLLLWEEIKQPVIMEKIYKFTNVRLKPNVETENLKYIELHSSKKTMISTVDPMQFQLLSVKNKNSYPRYHTNNNYSSKVQQEVSRPEKTKKIPEGIKLIKLVDIIKESQHQTQNQQFATYYFAECFIKVRTQSFRFKDDQANSYFNFFCGPCGRNVYTTLGDNDIVFCNNCKKDDVRVKYNLRVRCFDYHSQLPCSIQSQTTQRILNLSSKDGYLLYMKKKQQFQILLNKINFQSRVCKIQIKPKGLSKYFNILQIYAKDTRISLQSSFKNLLQTIKSSSQVHNNPNYNSNIVNQN